MPELEFGLDTFGDVPVDDAGHPLTHAASIRRVVEEAVLADYASGALPASARMRTVELYGSQVVPLVRDILSHGSRRAA